MVVDPGAARRVVAVTGHQYGMNRARQAAPRIRRKNMLVKVREQSRPEGLRTVVERVVQRDQGHALSLELFLAKMLHRRLVAKDFAVIPAKCSHMRGLLPVDTLLDDLQGGILDIQQVEPAPECRFENAELRLVTRANGKSRQRFFQR